MGLCARFAIAPVIVAVVFAVTACAPKPGDKCEKGQTTCLDGKSALVCQASAYTRVGCSGPKGCTGPGAGAACDISGAADGDACSTDDEGSAACSADSKAWLRCKGGKLRRSPCRGPRGCGGSTTLGAEKSTSCDESLAELGDPCVVEHTPDGMLRTTLVCSADRKSMLGCKNDKRVKESDCPGPKGCQDPPAFPMCDGEKQRW